jgi:hypothetical protein
MTGLRGKRPSIEDYVKRATQASSGRGHLLSSYGRRATLYYGKNGVQLRMHLEKQAQTIPAPALDRQHNYEWN